MSDETSTIKILQSLSRKLTKSYREMGVSVRAYLTIYIGGAAFLSVVLGTIATVIIDNTILVYSVYGLSAFFPLVAILYPLINQERKRKKIDNQFSLFVTHITILSLTNTDRVDVFREIANDKTYGALAEEVSKLVTYVDVFNMSLDDACRRRSEEVNSSLMKGFYERTAYNISSGKSLSSFLYSEQEDVQSMNEVLYESKLTSIDTVGELYSATMMSTSFIFVFAMLVPFLVSTIGPATIITAVMTMSIVTQSLFVVIMNTLSPADDLWIQDTDSILRQKLIMYISLLGATLLSAILLWVSVTQLQVEAELVPAISVVPMIIPSIVSYRYQRKILENEDQYPAFIRGLGSIESVKRTSTRSVVDRLRKKDFGRLTEDINSLYRRLTVSMDNESAWEIFSYEIGSRLIFRFSSMYAKGRRMGGDPEKLGELISSNFRRINQLRQKRSTAKTKLVGILYGMNAATTFTLFVALSILDLLVDIGQQVPNTTATNFLSPGVYNVPLIQGLVVLTFVLNALIASLMIVFMERRNITSFSFHFTIMTYINVSIAYIVSYAADVFLNL